VRAALVERPDVETRAVAGRVIARQELLARSERMVDWYDTFGASLTGEGEVPDFSIQFGGRLTLRSHSGLVTDVTT